ncbi:MAG: DUF5686 family protein [Bacteroidota bacterium]|nr:hypothetical protein [Odoribacter sp.]MDP3642571.1 DUF5686 family protein [Bacteroidota bacterium]
MYSKLNSVVLCSESKVFLILIFFLVALKSFSQPTRVSGKVIDQETGQPVSYVNIMFKNTRIGALSDSLGLFTLTSQKKVDSLSFSNVGYLSKIIKIQAGITSDLVVSLKPELIKLTEIQVTHDDGPVRRMLKIMVDRKKLNNPVKYDRYSYRKYTKWEYHLQNVGEKLIKSKLFRNDQSLFKSDSDSTKYLPVYFSEQLVFNEFQRNPLKQKSTVLADKTSGVGVLDDYEISGYTSALDIEVNFYDNYINLFLQNFVSPLADNGWFYYKYFLADSILLPNGYKEYRIEYFPRRPGDKVFKGYFTTENRNYSLVELEGTLASTSNLNFLKSMRLIGNYQLVNDSIPFFRRNQIDAIFNYVPLNNNPSKKPISLFFTQSAVIDSVSVGQIEDVKLNANSGRYETVKLPDATERDKNYWDNHRLEELDEREVLVSATIDSVSNINVIRFADNLGRMAMTGYYDLGKWEFGPYTNVINTNKVEGLHVFAGARTSSEISTRYMLWGGLGYGFRNKKINGIAGFGYKFPGTHRQLVKVSYDDKIVRAGENEKILFLYENSLSPTENNIVSQIFRRDELDELFREQKLATSWEYEWHPGLMNKLSANYTRHYSPEFYPYLKSGSLIGHVSAVELSLDTRFSWQEKVIDDKFLRIYMATDYPIIHFAVGGGKVFYSGKENYYGRFFATMEQYLRLGQTVVNYALEGGIYFGKLPYTMLDIPRGNETFGYYSYDFNMLNFMEYVHDKYLHAYLEYHLNGFVFNRLPLLKRIGLREVFSAKTMIGTLSDKHQEIVEFPVTIVPLGNPYLEVGAGVENIFRLFRVEAVWRVTPKSILGAPSFGLRAKFEIKL